MNGRTFWSTIIAGTLLSLIFSCARQMPPSGGPKDITPPKIIKAIPPPGTINFKGKKILLTFDEFIVLEKMNEKFMISPPVKKRPKITVKGKNLNIQFQENLKDSTTYTLYFQDAVRDLNEGNPIPNLQFVFSTGSVLDSLSVTGNEYNASDLEVTENTLILMYRQLADSAPVKLLPDYITLTDIKGNFRINNVKEGTYRLYALQDKNDNKKYDLADEGFAFMDNPVEINHTKNYLPVVVVKDTSKIKTTRKKIPEVPLIDGEYKLFLFTAPMAKHYLTSSGRKSSKLLTFTLSLPPDPAKFGFSIHDADKKNYFIEKNKTGDTINVWLTDSLLYSRQLVNTIVSYPFTDSTGAIKLKTDSIPMRFTAPRVTKAKEAKHKFIFSTNISGNTLKPGQQILFSSQTPFRVPDTTKIRLYESTDAGRSTVPLIFIKDSLNSRQYLMKAKLKEERNYILITDRGSFGDIFGDIADSTGIKFAVRSTDSYGRLTMNISNVTGDIIIQLLDTKEKLVSQKLIKKDGKVEFPLLEKGNYRVRAVYDLDHDGKWTTGDFKSKQQPEPVSYFPTEIEVKIDWEIQQDWDVSQKNQKDQKLRLKKDQNR